MASENTTAVTAAPVPPAPRGVIAQLVELLQHPDVVVARSQSGSPAPVVGLFAGSLLCAAAYGAGAGFFQGGSQIAIAMIKAPLIVVGSVLLCAPSLFVFSSLGGAQLTTRRFLTLLAGFSALLGLLLVGFLPIVWLFSVSSKSMLFVVFLHLGAWATGVFFGGRFVSRALGDTRGGGALVLWLGVFLMVSFQVTTVLRPVLWRPADGPLVESGKRFFTDQLGAAANFVDPTDQADAGRPDAGVDAGAGPTNSAPTADAG